MSHPFLVRPEPSEHHEYYRGYIDQVPPGNILDLMQETLRHTKEVLAHVPERHGDFCYEPGKWSLKDVVGHMVDTERVFAFRALSMARQDPAALPAMDQDLYAAANNTGDRSLASLVDELEAVRRASIALFSSFDAAAAARTGTASGFPFTVRTFPYIIVGHEIHHCRVLEKRYLGALKAG